MTIETVITCPLGSKCEEIKDNKLHRCAWYVMLGGQDPQTGKDVEEWKCSIAWLPIMNVEIANTNRGQTSAIESFRNETVEQAQTTNAILLQAAQQKAQEEHRLLNQPMPYGSGINSKWQ